MHDHILNANPGGRKIYDQTMSNFVRRMDRVWLSLSVDITLRKNLLNRPALMVAYVALNPRACIR